MKSKDLKRMIKKKSNFQTSELRSRSKKTDPKSLKIIFILVAFVEWQEYLSIQLILLLVHSLVKPISGFVISSNSGVYKPCLKYVLQC